MWVPGVTLAASPRPVSNGAWAMRCGFGVRRRGAGAPRVCCGLLDGRDVARVSRTVLGPEVRGRPLEGASGLLVSGGLAFLVVAGGLVMSKQLDAAVAEADRRRAAGEAEDEGLTPEALIVDDLRRRSEHVSTRPVMPLAVGLTSLMSGQVRGFNIQDAEAKARRGDPAITEVQLDGEPDIKDGPEGLPPLP